MIEASAKQQKLDLSLMNAARNGSLEQAQDALRQGANPNAAQGDWAALSASAMVGSVEVIRALLAAGALPEGPSLFEPALLTAIQVHERDCVEALLEGGANPNARREMGGETALMRAFTYGALGLSSARALLRAGADINAADHCGLTPLMLAARSGDQLAWEEALQWGADPMAVDNEGRDALMWAQEEQTLDDEGLSRLALSLRSAFERGQMQAMAPSAPKALRPKSI